MGCALFLLAARPSAAADPAAVVLVISDGTSQELLTAARIYRHGAAGKLGLESFAHSAIVRTHSREDVVTDSSAAATAMARGIKADNRCVGIATPDAESGPPSLLDLARQAGWSTGVVTDDSVTGATPAAFLVEHKSRWEDAQIAAKILGQLGPRADIVLGGGTKWFADLANQPDVTYDPGQIEVVRATRDTLALAEIASFTSWPAFVEAAAGGSDRPILGTFYHTQFPYYADAARTPRLAELAVEAVKFLRSKERPFFLMVEASLPDKACHLGQAKRAIVEVLELDHLLDELRRTLPAGSLILVTTDHNTGGLAINGPPVPLALRGDALMTMKLVGSDLSILSWATGPGANLAEANLRERQVTEPGEASRTVVEQKAPTDPDYQQPAAMAIPMALHTGGDVWLLADGPGSEAVHGYLDNTDIYRLIAARIAASASTDKR